MNQAVIIRDDAQMAVSFSEEAQRLKEQALVVGALVGRVTNATEQMAAVTAQTELQRILKLAEDARKACKAPVLEYGKRIDNAAKAFIAELEEEMLRIAKLVGDFQALELARARAAEQARNAELLELERQKAEAISKATSHDQVDAIQEHFNRQAETLPVHEPVRVDNQRIATDWEIVVNDVHKLYRAHANCVDLRPRISEIKNLLKIGVAVQGITATPIVRAGVTLKREQKAIEV